MRYKVAIHRTEEGISVSVPALPGFWSESVSVNQGFPRVSRRSIT
jgi:hypothetical protein